MRRHIATVGLLLAFGAAAGCSSTPDLGPVFNNEGDQTVSCMAHQTDKPGTRYTDKATRELPENRQAPLQMYKYYTANGAMAFCDGAAANDNDKAWAQVYLDLTAADPALVKTILG